MSGSGTATPVSGSSTGPTIYPVTLAEVKMQLRLDSGTFSDNVTKTQCLAHTSHAIGTHNGTGVDVLGHEAIVYLDSGVASGTNNTKIQECDTLAGTYTDWTGGAFTAVTGANDEAIQEIEYTGTKQYIRTASTVTVDACIFGTQVVTNEATFAEDTLLTNLIITATEWAEGYTRRKFINQTWDYCLDEFPDVDYIRIPYGNLQSVTSIKYKDTDATETTMTVTTDYLVETNGANYGRIVLPYGEVWPSDTLYPSNPITIKFVCGYGAVASSVPYRVKAAILRLVAKMYESRGEDTIGQTVSENKTFVDLLYPIRLWDEF
jgi:uncharacterized phiE125 gp8 family phage protein